MNPAEKRKIDHETDDEEDKGQGCAKRVSVSRKQHFLKAYNEKWRFLKPSTKGPSFVHCTLCKVEFSCAHGGRNDCERHVASKTHKKVGESFKGTASLVSVFQSQENKDRAQLQQQRVTNAEAQICRLIADANLPLSTSDRVTTLLKEIFPDSKIAQGIQCGRTKATVMIKELSALSMRKLAGQMKRRPFSIATDGSNEHDKTQFPLVIRTFNIDASGKLGQVTTQLLALRSCEGSATGENIFNLINAELEAQGVTWNNCISFGSDNAAVMTGRHKGVFSFVSKKNHSVYLAACSLHLVHIGAKKGAQCLPPIEETLVDIYYFFRKSTLRQAHLKELQDLYDVEQRRMLKHGCTRWLSIGRCIHRLLESWDPLKQLFHEELEKKKAEEEKKKKRPEHKKKVAKETQGVMQQSGNCEKQEEKTKAVDEEECSVGISTPKLQSIAQFLRSPTNKLYTMFLSYTLKVYDGVLVKFQAEEPMIHELRPSLVKLLTSLFSRFLKPVAIHGHQIKDIEYQVRYNQKDDKDLLIGDAARQLLKDPVKNNLRDCRITEFYSSVRQYFETTCAYLLSKLPLDDPLLKHAAVVDQKKQMEVSQNDLRYFISRFPALLSPGITAEMLEEQFVQYQITDVTECISERVDETWVNIGNTHKDLQALSEVMLGICTIPHSSAACERVFSCVRKNSTDQRASLGQDTMEALLVLKAQPPTVLSSEELLHLKSSYSRVQQQYK